MIKTKHKVATVKELVENGIYKLTEFLQSKGEKAAFSLYTNDALHVEVEGKTEVYFGIIIEMETELLGTKKLYFRKYSLKNKSLSDVQYAAYTELFDVMLGCFLTTAATAPDEILKNLSTAKQ